MSVFVDPREAAGTPVDFGAQTAELAVAVNPAGIVALEADDALGNNLPGDHPAWARDVLSLSARFRALLTRIKPVVIRVLTHWDHQVRSIMVGGRRVAVDFSGCYRIES